MDTHSIFLHRTPLCHGLSRTVSPRLTQGRILLDGARRELTAISPPQFSVHSTQSYHSTGATNTDLRQRLRRNSWSNPYNQNTQTHTHTHTHTQTNRLIKMEIISLIIQFNLYLRLNSILHRFCCV